MRTCAGWVWIAGSLLSGVLVWTDARAQTKPPGTQPGQIERQFQRPPEPSAKPGAITIPSTGQQPPANADSVKLVLDQVTIDGVTAYRADALATAYANLLRREVTLGDIYQLVDRLTAKYRNDGYILSQVFVPAQVVDGGVIRLQAVEGYISTVRVEGGTPALRDRVAKYASKIRSARPLTMSVLERYVLLVNDLPGVVARAVIAPSVVPGASDLILQLSQRQIAPSLNTDNRGGRAQGPARVLVDVDLNALTGAASRTEVRSVTTFNRELAYVSIAHDQFLGAEGGKLGISASYVYSEPQELSIVPLNLTTWSNSVTLSYSQSVFRRRSRNLYLRGVLSAFDSTTKVFGIDDTIDRVRSASVGLTYDAADRLGGVNVVDVAFTQGLPGLGASRNGERLLSRPGGRVDFRKSTLYAQRLQTLTARWSLVASAEAQYAFTDLLASEMFSIGGELFGRGYDPSSLLNDHGAVVKLDLRYGRTWSGRRPFTLVPYAFGDVGRVWQRTRPVVGDAYQSASSAGGGIRLHIGNQVAAFVEAAKPFNRLVGGDSSRDARVFAGVSVR